MSADENLKGTTVIHRRMGLSQGEIEEIRAEQRHKNAETVLEQFLAADGDAADED